MLITKTGKLPGLRLWRGECRACESEAEARESEMTHVVEDPRDGTKLSWEVCPVCQAGDKATGHGGMLFYPVKEDG